MATTIATQPGNRTSSSTVKAILLAGIIVGLLDISSAFVDYSIATGKNPIFVLNYVASGAFGKEALEGGLGMALAGLLFHFIIAFAFTIFFFWLYPKLPVLSRNRFITGVIYGLFIWAVMNLVVVPLSNIPKRPFNPLKALKAVLILIFMIGLPLSYIAYRYYYGKKQSPR